MKKRTKVAVGVVAIAGLAVAPEQTGCEGTNPWATYPATNPYVGEGEQVAVVGDSIVYETEKLSPIVVDGRLSVTGWPGLTLAQLSAATFDEPPQVLVVEGGTNDLLQHVALTESVAAIEAMSDAAPCVIFVTVTEDSGHPDMGGASELNAALPSPHVDWTHPDPAWTVDGIHPNQVGADILSARITSAVDVGC